MKQLFFIQSQNARVFEAFKIAGYEVKPFSDFSPGQHAIVVMPDISSLDDAASKGVPVIVVAGTRNVTGDERIQAALMCGIPDKCVLFLENGLVVDGAGETISPALRGNGISAHSVISVAEQAVKEQLVPEIPVWETNEESVSSHKEDPAIYEAEQKGEMQNAPVIANANSSETSNKTPLVQWLDRQMSLADKVVMVFGIRPGVGASTVAAGLTGVLEDKDAIYAEISDSLIGYTFFGTSTDEAVTSGRYAYCGSRGESVKPKRCGILVVEIGIKDAASVLYDKADFVVVVTDGTPPAFQRTGGWIGGGWRTDLLVVNKVVSGSGFPPEVYTGEYGITSVLGIPGGPEEETALHMAQTQGVLPFGHSVDLDAAFAKLADSVLNTVADKGAEAC